MTTARYTLSSLPWLCLVFNLSTIQQSGINAFVPETTAAYVTTRTGSRSFPAQSQQASGQTEQDGKSVSVNLPYNGNVTSKKDDNIDDSGSIDSLLKEMQKQEEQLRTKKGGGEAIQPVTLDAGNLSSASKQRNNKNNENDRKLLQRQKEPKAKSKAPPVTSVRSTEAAQGDVGDDYDLSSRRENLSTMDTSTARELDNAVTWMVSTPSAREELLDSVDVMPLPSLYSSSPLYSGSTATNQTTTTTNNKQQPSRPGRLSAQYFKRISRDMRHLAVSIASSIESVDQWRTFCQEGNGGLMPLLECIREGARFIHLQKKVLAQKRGYAGIEGGVFLEQHEETFMAACSACRALRDLCAVSPELSAVITDGILRANAAWSERTFSTAHRSREFNNYKDEEGAAKQQQVHQFGNNLMHDFMTMLKYANEYSEPNPRRDSMNPFSRSRNRRGTSTKLIFLFVWLNQTGNVAFFLSTFELQ